VVALLVSHRPYPFDKLWHDKGQDPPIRGYLRRFIGDMEKIASTVYRGFTKDWTRVGDNDRRASKQSVSFALTCRYVCRYVGGNPPDVTLLISNSCTLLSPFMPECRRSAWSCLAQISYKNLLTSPLG
jgi:hypothetical protein